LDIGLLRRARAAFPEIHALIKVLTKPGRPWGDQREMIGRAEQLNKCVSDKFSIVCSAAHLSIASICSLSSFSALVSLFNSYDSSLRRPRSTATPPSRRVNPLAADAGSISGALVAGDVQTPGVVLLPVDPQPKDSKSRGDPAGKKAVQVADIIAESPPTPPISTLVAVN
jgi:hypothetical protein